MVAPLLVGLMVGTIPPVLAAVPGADSLAAGHSRVDWSGGPLEGTYNQGTCIAPSCDQFTLDSTLASSYWSGAPGGIAVRISWADTNEELDLFVLDSAGNVITSSQLGGVDSQQVFLSDPPPGAYVIQVQAFFAVNLSYRGTATVVGKDAVQAKQAASSLRFSAPAVVDPQFTTGEPGLLLDSDGTAYVDAPWHQEAMTSFVWRSRPDQAGLTFDLLDSRLAPGVSDPRRRSCTGSGGGGDVDLAEDRTGRLYLADLEAASVGVSLSTDRGNTWTCSPLSASHPQDDRPWLATAPGADGAQPNVDAYLFYRTNFVSGVLPGGELAGKPSVQLDMTRDGGHTWTARSSIASGLVMETGPAFTTSDGTLYEIFSGVDGGVWMAISSDQGLSFRLKLISSRPGSPSNSFVTAAADSAGNLYAAWADGGSFDVLYSYSRDRGSTWSRPTQVSPADSTAVMPWIAAAGPGDVAIGWYGSSGRFQPGLAAPSQPWFPTVARSLGANLKQPAFQVERMSVAPTHFGAICLSGALCSSDRSLADFFKIGIGPDGGVVATYDDNGRIPSAADGGPPAPYVEMVRQTSGLGMTRSALALNVGKSNGDARFPPSDPSGVYIPSLGFTSMPAVMGMLPKASIRFSLGDVRNLRSALSATATGVATDAYWLMIWKAGDRVEYAGMHIDRTGIPNFFGGDDPVPVGIPGAIRNASGEGAFSYASYPAAFTLDGSVDPASGSVTIDLANGNYRLTQGEMLRSLQAFSMTGSVADAQALPLQVIDSTAPHDVVWTSAPPSTNLAPLGQLRLTAHGSPPAGTAGRNDKAGSGADTSTVDLTAATPVPRVPNRSARRADASSLIRRGSGSPIPDAAFAALLAAFLSILFASVRLGAFSWKPSGGRAKSV